MKSLTHSVQTIEQALDRKDQGQPAWCWFDERRRGHGSMSGDGVGKPVMPPNAAQVLWDTMQTPPLSICRHLIYVHIPFCSKICQFCAFNRRAGQEQMFEPFTKAVLEQIKRYAQTHWVQQGKIDAIFFGGGTPTALPESMLIQLVEGFTKHFPLSENCEITVESRIDDVTDCNIKNLVHAGVNRMSFGVQSFDTQVRRAVGRIADQTTVLKTLDHIRNEGIINLGLDLIYNLPEQTLDSWCKDLALLATTPANSVSIYALILQKGSALARQIEEGTAPLLLGLAEEYAYFSQTDKVFAERGNWKQFSLAHFGDPAIERSGYNSARAGGVDILGLGPGAAGSIDNLAYMNTHDVQSYMQDQIQDQDQHMMGMQFGKIADRQASWRQLTDGLSIHVDALKTCGNGMTKLIKQFETLQVIQRHDDRLCLTQAGRFWSGNLTDLINQTVLEDEQNHSKEVAPNAHFHTA